MDLSEKYDINAMLYENTWKCYIELDNVRKRDGVSDNIFNLAFVEFLKGFFKVGGISEGNFDMITFYERKTGKFNFKGKPTEELKETMDELELKVETFQKSYYPGISTEKEYSVAIIVDVPENKYDTNKDQVHRVMRSKTDLFLNAYTKFGSEDYRR